MDENDFSEPNTFVINGVRLVMTSWACPEQYDAYIGDRQIGYLRLRHGWFRADRGGCGGETVYASECAEGDGQFRAFEREQFLTDAVNALLEADRT